MISASRAALLAAVLGACAPASEPPAIRLFDAGADWDALCGLQCTCNPLTQTGCNAQEKCTWVLGGICGSHIGCGSTGTTPRGAACEYAQHFDGCAKGDVCTGGTCRKICDHNGGEPRCEAGETCAEVDAFIDGVGHLAGVCLP